MTSDELRKLANVEVCDKRGAQVCDALNDAAATIDALQAEVERLKRIIDSADGKDAASFDWSVLNEMDRGESERDALRTQVAELQRDAEFWRIVKFHTWGRDTRQGLSGLIDVFDVRFPHVDFDGPSHEAIAKAAEAQRAYAAIDAARE